MFKYLPPLVRFGPFWTRGGGNLNIKIGLFKVTGFYVGISKNATNIICLSIKYTYFFKIWRVWQKKLSLPCPFMFQNSKGRGRPNFWARPSKFWKNIYFLKINKWCYHDILVSLLVSDLKKMTRTFLSRLQSSLP